MTTESGTIRAVLYTSGDWIVEVFSIEGTWVQHPVNKQGNGNNCDRYGFQHAADAEQALIDYRLDQEYAQKKQEAYSRIGPVILFTPRSKGDQS